MKKYLLALVLVFVTTLASAETVTWKELYLDGNATKVGAVYAATCTACMGGDYVSHEAGVWQCDNTPDGQGKECASKIWEALTLRYTPTPY